MAENIIIQTKMNEGKGLSHLNIVPSHLTLTMTMLVPELLPMLVLATTNEA